MTSEITAHLEPTYRSVWTDLMDTEFKQGWVDAGGIRTRYAQAGNADAPALIMLHGTAGSWETYSATLGAHAAHMNCYALDMVGTGLSDKPDQSYHIADYVRHVAAFMDAMGIRSACLMGVSLGSWVAARFALTHPERTDKLVLVSPAGLYSDPKNMERIRTQRGDATENPTWEKISGVFSRLIMDPKNRIADLVAIRQKVYQLPEMKQAMRNILVLQDPEQRSRNEITEDEWRTLQAPVLLIGAVDADDIYLKTAKRLREILPRATYREMKGVSHWGHFEDPAVFNPLSVQFLLGD